MHTVRLSIHSCHYLDVRGAKLLAEHSREGLDDEEEHTAAGGKTEHLGREALVERTEALLTGNAEETGVGPLAGVVELQAGLDDVDWGSARVKACTYMEC